MFSICGNKQDCVDCGVSSLSGSKVAGYEDREVDDEYLSKNANLHYTRLIFFRVSRVSATNLHDFAPGSTHQGATVASCWQRDEDRKQVN